jgi:hypothetical protein
MVDESEIRASIIVQNLRMIFLLFIQIRVRMLFFIAFKKVMTLLLRLLRI